ncbi:MAG TPA: MFS transporter [Xanthobacteraceae bacterium]|nr:MFS transporter [Xanthobacteraceae bacterium]
MSQLASVEKFLAWRTPAIILACGALVSAIGFGPRSALGLFLKPMSVAHGWERDVFALALALQMLLWGAGQPIAGAIADRYGAARVLIASTMLYAGGLAMMAYSATPGMLYLSAGMLIGFGLSGSSFQIVLGAFAKLMPARWRSLSFGLGTAAGSFGQFLFSPLAVAFLTNFGWQTALVIFAGLVLLMVPLALPLATPGMDNARSAGTERQQSLMHALAEAFRHRSYLLLVTGFFTCGFQLFFITVHLPAYLVDRGLTVAVGAWTLAAIGLFNIVGSLSAGWLSDRLPKRYILSTIYLARSIAIFAFITLPPSTVSSVIFGAVMGLLWLSTVPPTNGLVALMFGTRWLTMLAGVAFFSHQVGGFLGVWLGGVLFERTGSYSAIWWMAIVLGVLSAIVNLPIIEKPVARVAPAPA